MVIYTVTELYRQASNPHPARCGPWPLPKLAWRLLSAPGAGSPWPSPVAGHVDNGLSHSLRYGNTKNTHSIYIMRMYRIKYKTKTYVVTYSINTKCSILNYSIDMFNMCNTVTPYPSTLRSRPRDSQHLRKGSPCRRESRCHP